MKLLLILLLIPIIYSLTDFSPFLQRIFCKIGWHSNSYDTVKYYSSDMSKPINCQCKWCKKIRITDNQNKLL